jgi:2OG-Fe(II) oxygenase superfamily/Glycosyltransferase (GlcNAc)
VPETKDVQLEQIQSIRTQTNNMHEISGWSPITTRLLRDGGESAWNYIDDSDGEFCRHLRHELSASGLISRLQQAMTVSEQHAAQILSGLVAEEERSLLTGNRGDRSVFVTRAERSVPEFANAYPLCLSCSIPSRSTIHNKLSLDFNFEFSSVQLAEYPGDGSSHYPRHCDVQGEACRGEAAIPKETQRIITAIYYCTLDDWNAALDGGCLRLYTSGTSTVDIPPYAGRLVIFRSDCVEHSVLASLRRPRHAVTVWLYGKPKKEKQMSAMEASSSSCCGPSHVANAVRQGVYVNGPPPLPSNRETDNTTNLSTIFVSIPAFRDSEAGPTIRNLMRTARYPESSFIGLVLQIDMENESDH